MKAGQERILPAIFVSLHATELPAGSFVRLKGLQDIRKVFRVATCQSGPSDPQMMEPVLLPHAGRLHRKRSCGKLCRRASRQSAFFAPPPPSLRHLRDALICPDQLHLKHLQIGQELQQSIHGSAIGPDVPVWKIKSDAKWIYRAPPPTVKTCFRHHHVHATDQLCRISKVPTTRRAIPKDIDACHATQLR